MSNKVKGEALMEMTQDAYDELKKELKERKSKFRKEIAQEISNARELGDLSENHAYTVAMEKKDLNEARIADLEDMIKNAKVVKTSTQTNVVRVGNKVEIENIASNSIKTVILVGTEETRSAEPGEGKISVDSPIGKAIVNSKIGETVVAKLPAREIEFKVLRFVD